MKRIPVFFLSLLLVLGAARAATDPTQVVADNARQMLAALQENRAELDRDPGRIYDLVDDILLPHFDFRTMSRWVLGRYWRQADRQQQEQFVDAFRTLLVNTYSNALLEYSNEEFRVLPSPMDPDRDDVTVRSEIAPRSGPSIPISYSMHHKGERWLVYDVAIDGVSLVTNYRGSFADHIRRDGMQSLIDSLQARNAGKDRP